MSKIIDLIGKKFGKLTVLGHSHFVKGRHHWKCRCECGKICIILGDSIIRGNTKSCGCLQFGPRNNIIGYKFGRLTVIKFDRMYKGHAMWICECECSKHSITSVRGSHLKVGAIKSCGCSQLEDITNQIFSYLTAIEFLRSNGKHSYWKCKCKCGNYTEVSLNNLRRGQVRSCGCCSLISESSLLDMVEMILGSEYEIKRHHHIDFLGKQHIDGAVYRNNVLLFCIEYDGKQHFSPIVCWGGEENLKYIKKMDKRKNKLCKDNNIPLIRVAYYEKITKELIIKKFKKAGL
jgi:hypothetical protein